MYADYEHRGYECNRRCLDERQRLLTADLGVDRGQKRGSGECFWSVWTLIRQNYFRMLSAGPSQDVGLLPCPNLPAPMLARVHQIYMHNVQMCIPGRHKDKPEHMDFIRWLGHCEIGCLSLAVCYFALLKKAAIAAPVFCLARRCSSDRCGVLLQACVFTQTSICILVYTCVCNRERRVRRGLTKHVYAYIFNSAHMLHTPPNLAAVRDCLVLLDDQSVGESNLL